jgi:hypothetical protein
MGKAMCSTLDLEISCTVVCEVCGGPLKVRVDETRTGRDEVTVEFCTSCRDDADNNGYDRGYAEGLAKGEAN